MNTIPEIKDIDAVRLTALMRQSLDSPAAEIS